MRANKVINKERKGNDAGGGGKVHDEYGKASGRGDGREGPCFIQKRDQEEKFEGYGNVDAPRRSKLSFGVTFIRLEIPFAVPFKLFEESKRERARD